MIGVMINGPVRAIRLRPAVLTTLVLGVGALVGSVGWVADAAPSPGALSSGAPAQSGGSPVQLELIEEQYSFGPDESLHLVYRLTGDLEALGLVPTPPAPETTVVETTVPETTVPETAVPNVPPTGTPRS